MDNNHNKINGEDYRKLIITAAQYLEENEEEINELNVFPVPDGDTGSNMSMTVSRAAEELLRLGTDTTLDEVASTTAKAMLHGARGNSGVIISLLFRGIAKGLINAQEADGIAWANALRSGVEAAYNAVDNPAEGTILTVARCCAEAAEQAARTIAMQTASDNGDRLLTELTLEYNKGRQQKITAEILDLVGGLSQ